MVAFLSAIRRRGVHAKFNILQMLFTYGPQRNALGWLTDGRCAGAVAVDAHLTPDMPEPQLAKKYLRGRYLNDVVCGM